METPTSILMQAVNDLYSKGKEKAEKYSSSTPLAINALINTTPEGQIVNSVRAAGPFALQGVQQLGDSIRNNPKIKSLVNDPIVRGIAGMSPTSSLMSIGLSGSQIISALGDKSKSSSRKAGDEIAKLTKLKDGSLRTGGGDVYSPDGKRITTSMGLTFDLGTGQSINPSTNQISKTGYSINPSTGKRTDNPAKNLTQTPPVDSRGPSAADLTQDEGMRIWAEKFGTLAKRVKEGQAGYEVIQDTLYPKTEEGFANPDKPVIEMIDGQKLQEPMSINQFNDVQEVRDFNMKPTSVMSVLAQKDPQKALNEFMTANGLVTK